MSNNEQNGRQPPLPQQSVPSTTAPAAPAVIPKSTKSLAPTDPRFRNASVPPAPPEQIKRCRDFVWGICTKGAQCRFRHELDVEYMKNILKFCHDYQNRTGCTRPDCTYLHTSKEEQNLFLNTGQIPRALAERYAAMSTGPVPINMYVNEYIAQAPPPPPPPPPPPSAVAPQPPLPAPMPPLLAPPPPPPPPPPPATTAAPIRMTPPILSAPPPFNAPTMFSVSQPPPALPAIFDASMPPPPLPTNTTLIKNGALKRPAEPSEAGPSKTRKAECSKVVDSVCENCIQRELRIELYRQELQKLECEREYQAYIYEKKSAENANGRLLLKSSVSPELFRILDDHIEGTSQQVQAHDLLSQFNQTSSFVSETSTVPRQFLLQLMGCVLNQRTLVEPPPPTPSLSVDEQSLLTTLSALTRRASPVNHTSTDVLHAVLDLIRNNSASSDRNQTNESRTNDAINSDRSRASSSNMTPTCGPVNGFNHFGLNGHKELSVPPPAVASPSRYPTTANIAVRTFATRTASTTSLTQTAAHLPTPSHLPNASLPPALPRPAIAAVPPSGPHPPNPTHPLPVRAVTAPTPYLPYHRGPPPNRGYFPQPYASTSNHVPNIHQSYPNSPVRGAVAPQIPARPPTSTAPPVQNAQNFNPYAMGRYPPQPHNYPPFQ